jgi:hypothetical protein
MDNSSMGMVSIMSNCGNRMYGAVSAAETNSRSFDQGPELQSCNSADRHQVLTGLDLVKIIEGLKRRFAWYGFRSIELGPFVRIKDDTISIDLFIRGNMLGRVEVDQHSGVVTSWFLPGSVRDLRLSEARLSLLPVSRDLPSPSRSTASRVRTAMTEGRQCRLVPSNELNPEKPSRKRRVKGSKAPAIRWDFALRSSWDNSAGCGS